MKKEDFVVVDLYVRLNVYVRVILAFVRKEKVFSTFMMYSPLLLYAELFSFLTLVYTNVFSALLLSSTRFLNEE